MGKLHELLAAEPDLKSGAQRTISQIKSLFTDGRTRFVGQVRTYQSLLEGGDNEPDEIVQLASRVKDELLRLEESYGRWLDAAIQKEVTNQNTSAIIEGLGFLDELPATALLNLESKLAELRALYETIPVNDPAITWNRDEQRDCFASTPRKVFRSKKVPKSQILYEATPEHPAQVQMYHEDIRIGQYTTTTYSGALSPADKRRRLSRVSELIRAVKQARMRANCEEVVDVRISKLIFSYINSG